MKRNGPASALAWLWAWAALFIVVAVLALAPPAMASSNVRQHTHSGMRPSATYSVAADAGRKTQQEKKDVGQQRPAVVNHDTRRSEERFKFTQVPPRSLY
jgi:hypothetical protein